MVAQVKAQGLTWKDSVCFWGRKVAQPLESPAEGSPGWAGVDCLGLATGVLGKGGN